MNPARKQVLEHSEKAFLEGKQDFYRGLTQPLYTFCPYHVKSLKGLNWIKGYQVGQLEHTKMKGGWL